MKFKYKAGDTVRILPNPSRRESTTGCHWASDMSNYVGDTFELTQSTEGNTNWSYKTWNWSEEWLQLVKSKNIPVTRKIPTVGKYIIQSTNKEDWDAALIEGGKSKDYLPWHEDYQGSGGQELYIRDGKFDGWCWLGYGEKEGYPKQGFKIIKLDKSKKSMASKLGTMMKKLLDADTQVLVKAGFINGDLELTSEGSNELENAIFDDYKAKLVAVAKEKLAEEEADK